MSKPTVASLTLRLEMLEARVARLESNKKPSRAAPLKDPAFQGTYLECSTFCKDNLSRAPLIQGYGNGFGVFFRK